MFCSSWRKPSTRSVILNALVLHDVQVLLQLGVHLEALGTAYKAIEDGRQRLRSPLELDHFARQFVYAPRDARVA